MNSITRQLTPALIEALKNAPLNATIRTQVHASLHVPIPDDKLTFHDIKQWIEKEYTPPPSPAQTRDWVPFTADVTDTEKGSCRYSANRRGHRTYRVDLAQLRDLMDFILGRDQGWDRFFGKLSETIQGIVEDDLPDMERNDEDLVTGQFDSDEHSDQEIITEIDHEAVVDFLRTRYPVDCARLGETTPQPPPVHPDPTEDDDEPQEEEEQT